MKCLIVSDIFGKTPELEQIAYRLSSDSGQTTLIDPYDGLSLNFDTEGAAYEYFQKKGGLGRYKETLLGAMADIRGNHLLIGFSVGASSIWAVSDMLNTRFDVAAVCFYGSQIRHYLDIEPTIPMEMIFPDTEPHFEVPKLIERISRFENVTCRQVPFGHGFMNKRSVNFNQTGYERFLTYLEAKLDRNTAYDASFDMPSAV